MEEYFDKTLVPWKFVFRIRGRQSIRRSRREEEGKGKKRIGDEKWKEGERSGKGEKGKKGKKKRNKTHHLPSLHLAYIHQPGRKREKKGEKRVRRKEEGKREGEGEGEGEGGEGKEEPRLHGGWGLGFVGFPWGLHVWFSNHGIKNGEIKWECLKEKKKKKKKGKKWKMKNGKWKKRETSSSAWIRLKMAASSFKAAVLEINLNKFII